jgi:hypothetical protein
MAIFYGLGDALVSNDELQNSAAQGKLQKLQSALISKSSDVHLEFMFGDATGENMARSFVNEQGEVIDFHPIGIGKPLTVQIRHVYTGNSAEGFFGSKGMLVASAMKSMAMYDAAPRAINFLLEDVKNNQDLRTVDAVNKGTPLICYTPALSQSSSIVTIELMFDSFPKETFDAISKAFGTAAGIPIFVPMSAYLVAAGIVTKLLGNVGKSLANGHPALRRTEEITFITPGSEIAVAHFALLIADDVETSVLQNHKISSRGMLVRSDTQGPREEPYSGPHPYIVISLDGRENDDLKGFVPAAASAALLDRFYNINDGNSQPLAQLIEGLKLYNDLKYREKAVAASEKMTGYAKDSREYKDLLAHYNAFRSNIGNDLLKPAGQG